jgi:CRP/FNR family transcriptional regulator
MGLLAKGQDQAQSNSYDGQEAKLRGSIMSVVTFPKGGGKCKSSGVSATSPCETCPVGNLAFCAALDPAELDILNSIVTRISLTPQQMIFGEGDEADHVFNVTEGAVRLYKIMVDGRRQITGFLFPGDFMGLAAHETYAYSAEAITQTSMCRFPRKKLESLLQQYPKLEKRLLEMVVDELTTAQDQMLLLGRQNAQERLVSFLLMLSRRAVERGQPDDMVRLAMLRQDIADYLGLTTETVSRAFTQLKQAGTISLQSDSRVSLNDRQALEDIAAG